MLELITDLSLGKYQADSGGGSGGSTPTEIALLSVTTAPSGSFAVGSKYYNSSTKKIVTAVTADTWTGATSADPVFNVIYTYDSGYYAWDGNSLELTDLNLYEKVANKTDSYTETSPTKYPSSKALSDGLGSVVIPNASNTVAGKIRIATDAEVVTGTAENLAVNPKQLKTGIDSAGGEIFDIIIESERTTKPGRAGLFSDTVNPLARADIPLAYAKALDGYNNAETEQADPVVATDVVYGGSPAEIQYHNGRYYAFTGFRYLKSSANIDMSSASVEIDLGNGYATWYIGANINIIIINADPATNSKLRIYSKAWDLLQEYDNDYGLYGTSFGEFHSKFYKYGTTIYVTTTDGVIEIEDNAVLYTPVYHSLGKNIHALAYFKSNWYFGYTNGWAGGETNYYSKNADLTSVGTTLFIRDNFPSQRPSIAHNDDYIVCQHIRDIGFTGDCNTYTEVSSDGTNWTGYNVNNTEIPDYIYFKGTSDNKFIIYGAKIGITSTSDPLTWTGKTTTATYYGYTNENSALNSPDGIAFVVSTNVIYSTIGKKVYTDTIKGIEIEYYLAPSGQKICLPTQNTALANLYALTGDNSYLVLDTVGETLQLYRRNVGYEYMVVDSDYVCPLINNVSQERFAKYSELPKLKYSQLADKTIANTDVETSVINTTAGEYIGSNVIPANSLTAGDVISIKAKGIISTASSAPTTILKAKLGSVVLIESSGALPTGWDGVYFELNAEITIRAIGATGKAIIGGNTLFKDATTMPTGVQRALIGTETEIDTTINNTLDITYIWSAASEDNAITVKQAHFEIKKQW